MYSFARPCSEEDLPQIVVPGTYPEFTRRKVITSEWLDGEKLSQSTNDDVSDLVGNSGAGCRLTPHVLKGSLLSDLDSRMILEHDEPVSKRCFQLQCIDPTSG